MNSENGLLLLPEMQYEYALLDFKNLHISKKVKRLLKNNKSRFCINSNFDEIIEKISLLHKESWIKENYLQTLKALYSNNLSRKDFQVMTFSLIDKETDELIAGEIGYVIGATYTSLSGFSSRDKTYSNYGTLQLVLLSKYLESKGFEFWNLGHPQMSYKKKLGCIIYKREDFLKRWSKAILLKRVKCNSY